MKDLMVHEIEWFAADKKSGSKRTKPIVKINLNCPQHAGSNKVQFYCDQCRLSFCELCIPGHSAHATFVKRIEVRFLFHKKKYVLFNVK